MASNFFQDGPRLGNAYLEDTALRDILRRLVPASTLDGIEEDLTRFGSRVVNDVRDTAQACMNNHELPRVHHYDRFGRRIDDLETSDAWKKLHDVAAEEGLVAIGYERSSGEYSRLHQFAKLHLFAPASATFACPLAMTDGAARLIEVSGDGDTVLQDAYTHLTSREARQFWTSGQWMTERAGGSDVGRTGTIAERAVSSEDGRDYELTGFKWFTSATDSDMAMTLARVADDYGATTSGSKGLSLFFLRVRDDERVLNNIQIHRLKNKLGTRSLPTAELSLHQTKARLVGEAGQGVKTIASSMINITRLYNSISACSQMRFAIAVARDYAHRREAFGHKLRDLPLHVSTLAAMETTYRGNLQLVMELILRLGHSETTPNVDQADADLLRLLIPLAKLFTAKHAVSIASEGIECLGGQGYMEDTPLAANLREAQVLPIWEGTTNVLALDFLRAIAHSKTGFAPIKDEIEFKLRGSENMTELGIALSQVTSALHALNIYHADMQRNGIEWVQATAREHAMSVTRTYVAAILIQHAVWSGNAGDAAVATRWVSQHGPLITTTPFTVEMSEQDRQIALDMTSDGGYRGCGDADASGAPRAKL